MQSLTQDAQRISLLFHYGVLGADAVITWADHMIVELDKPPDSLLELSTTAPDKTADIVSCLNKLRSGAELWPALRSAIPGIRDFIKSHPDRAGSIANYLFHTACTLPFPEMPTDLHFIYRFDEAFSMADEGIYGDAESIYREFVHAMEKFK